MTADDANNPFDPKRLGLPAELIQEQRRRPKKLQEWDERYARLPMTWVERLRGASGQTWAMATLVAFLDFWVNVRLGKKSGRSFKLANGMLKEYGVASRTKCRTLHDLERRGCVTVEWWPKKSPIVRLLP
jgi:hypothetical protein